MLRLVLILLFGFFSRTPAHGLERIRIGRSVRNVVRSIREVAATVRHDRSGIVAYIEKSFKVTPGVAAEAYEDINGVIIETLMMPDEQLKRYLDNASNRGEIAKPLAVSDAFDLSLLRSLK